MSILTEIGFNPEDTVTLHSETVIAASTGEVRTREIQISVYEYLAPDYVERTVILDQGHGEITATLSQIRELVTALAGAERLLTTLETRAAA